VRNWTTWEIA
jgi:rplS_bact: ribosomal protein L19